MEVNINSSNFEKEVIEYKGTVIVDFYGSWCMPCKMIAPIVEKVVADNNFKLAKIDVDDNEDIAREYNVMSIPTILIFENGELINKIVGLRSREDLVEQFK